MPPIASPTAILLYIVIFLLMSILIYLLNDSIRKGWNRIILAIKGWLSLAAVHLAGLLQRTERKLSKNSRRPGDNLYEELTPLDNVDEDKVYDQQLKWALGKNNIRNIAITGTYGSGKSSVIRTFQKNHREFKYLNISLASFPEDIANKKNTSKDEPNGFKEQWPESVSDYSVLNTQLVEFSILQQIILHIHHKRLPGSRFHRIRHQQPWKTLLSALFLIGLLITGCYIFNKPFFNSLMELLSWKNEHFWYNILPYLFISGATGLIYSLLRIYANSMISKVKIPAAELEVEKKEASVLNKQIEEILYFFEVTDYEVVVIEDLDRFGHPGIFTKLREINLLINNAEQVKRNVVFIYVLGDHVFKGEHRTKFFDYIVPVIPVVNSSNAYQLLTDRIKKANLTGSLPDQFIDEVSLYISDMRLLKNIMNEFNLYYAKLKKGKTNTLNDDYLFSLVVYKNLFPNDFALLQTGKGLVVNEFERKNEYIIHLTDQLRKRNEELEKLIGQEKAVLQNSVEELRLVYIGKWLGMQQNRAIGLKISSTVLILNELIRDEHFNAIRKLKTPVISYQNSVNSLSWENSSIDFDKAATTIDPDFSYDEKERALNARSDRSIELLKEEMEKNKEEIRRISDLPLKDLLGRVTTSLISAELRDCRLLHFLLRNGHINEEYPYYISHFYPGSLLLEEHEFILSLKERKPKQYNYQLVNMSAILKRLYAQDFREEAILNNYLVDHLLQNENSFSGFLASVMQLLSNNKKYSTEFIDQFIQSTKSTPAFVAQLSKYWTNWWDHVQEHPTATEEFKQKCYLLLLQHAEIPNLKAMNVKGSISAWLAELRTLDIPAGKLTDLLSALPVKLKHVTQSDLLTTELTEHIYLNNLYEFNPEMLQLILQKKAANVEGLPPFNKTPYSAIMAADLPVMMEYISNYPDLFIRQGLLAMEVPLEEPEEVLIDLLENPEIHLELREAIIRKMSGQVNDLNLYTQELWVVLLQENKVVPAWNNVFAYFNHITAVDEALASYVNRIENALKLLEVIDWTNIENFNAVQALVNSPLTSVPVFEKIVPDIPRSLTEVNIEGMNQYKINLLIRYSLIPLNNENFLKLKAKSRDLASEYLINYNELLFPVIAEFELDGKDYLTLLNSDKISIEQKTGILSCIPDTLYTYSPLATAAIKFILFEGVKCNFSTCLIILENCSDKELSVMLAKQQLQNDPSVVYQILAVMGEDYARLANPNVVINFSYSDNKKVFFKLLRESGILSKISIKENDITVYTRKNEGE